jgi:hypothetical protein
MTIKELLSFIRCNDVMDDMDPLDCEIILVDYEGSNPLTYDLLELVQIRKRDIPHLCIMLDKND